MTKKTHHAKGGVMGYSEVTHGLLQVKTFAIAKRNEKRNRMEMVSATINH